MGRAISFPNLAEGESAMLRRLLRAALVLLAAGSVFAGMTAAYADPFFPDPKTSVMVTRLTVTDGKGWLVLQPRIGHDTAIGFGVRIPAGAGSWTGPAAIAVYDMGIRCVRLAGPDLNYQCGSDGADGQDPPPLLPSGGYQITIPVTRTGAVTGLTGATNFWEVSPYDGPVSYNSDTFPVVDGTHFRSTAEVRNFYTGLLPSSLHRDRGDIAVTMTVVPGERVHAVDIQLPPADWRLLAYQLHPLVDCQLTGAPTAPLIHCAPITAGRDFPAGRYPFVIKVDLPEDEDFSLGQPGTVALGVNGADPVIGDTFGWYNALIY